MVESLGVETVAVRTPADLDRCERLIMPGGESSTISMLLDRAGLTEPLAKRLDDGMAAFGTCAGAILLGREILDGRPDQRAFGAIDLVVRRNGYGRQVDSFEADLDVRWPEGALATGVGTPAEQPPLRAVFIRAPVIERAGPDVKVLAQFEDQPVLCRQRTILVASFHPELTHDDRLHRAFLEM